MTMRHYLKIRIYLLLLLLIFVTSCNGQVKIQSQETVNDSKISTNGQPKMVKKQGIYSYLTHTGPHTDTNICIGPILEDKFGNIWVTTMGEGVYRYDRKSFANFTVKDGLIANVVYSIIEDNEGNIWFGTISGVSRYNGKSFTNFPFSVIKGGSTFSLGTNTTNPYTEVWSMLQDKSGKIWFGTTDGVYCYNGTTFTNILELATSNTSNLKLNAVPSIIEDKNGNIWFTSWYEGLCRFDGKSITTFRPTIEGGQNLLEDRNGNIWISRRGNGGVYHYDGKDFKSLFSGIMINEMKEDKSGNIWFCTIPNNKTHTGGVMYYNPSTSETISHFTTKDGLSHNWVFSVTIDKSGNVWFGASGMTLSNYNGKAFTNFFSE